MCRKNVAKVIVPDLVPTVRKLADEDESVVIIEEVGADLLQQRLDFLVHYAEFGTDADKRDYEVDYSRIQSTGFKTEIDIHTGLSELIDGLRIMRIKNPYSNV